MTARRRAAAKIPGSQAEMPLEHACKVTLIGEPGLLCDLGKSAIVNRQQLPAPQYAELPDVLPERALAMLGKGAT